LGWWVRVNALRKTRCALFGWSTPGIDVDRVNISGYCALSE
jgi:hypothetical protein